MDRVLSNALFHAALRDDVNAPLSEWQRISSVASAALHCAATTLWIYRRRRRLQYIAVWTVAAAFNPRRSGHPQWSGRSSERQATTHSLRRHRSDSEVVEFVQSPFRVSISRPISRATIYHALSSKPALQPYFSSLRHLGLLRAPFGRHCKQQYLSVSLHDTTETCRSIHFHVNTELFLWTDLYVDVKRGYITSVYLYFCLLYTSDAADE